MQGLSFAAIGHFSCARRQFWVMTPFCKGHGDSRLTYRDECHTTTCPFPSSGEPIFLKHAWMLLLTAFKRQHTSTYVEISLEREQHHSYVCKHCCLVAGISSWTPCNFPRGQRVLLSLQDSLVRGPHRLNPLRWSKRPRPAPPRLGLAQR